MLGGKATVATLTGEQLRLTVNAGTQPDSKLRLRGKGMPIYKKEGERGDLIVTFHVAIPTTLTEGQRESFVQLSKE